MKKVGGQLSHIGNTIVAFLIAERMSGRAAHKLISSDQLIAGLRSAIKAWLVEHELLNPYTSDRVKQLWYYPKGWTVPSLDVQAQRLLLLFPGIRLPHASHSKKRVKGADGLAYLPTLRFLGQFFKVKDPYGAGYGQVIERLCSNLHKQRNGAFHNYRKGGLTEAYIRLYAEVKERLMRLETATTGDVLVLPISFGNLYAGWGVRAARWEAIDQEQLPLGAAHVACLLLVMPERLTAHGQLNVDCPGDEFNWGADGRWSFCLCFRFSGGQLELGARESRYPRGCDGSAVAFPEVAGE